MEEITLNKKKQKIFIGLSIILIVFGGWAYSFWHNSFAPKEYKTTVYEDDMDKFDIVEKNQKCLLVYTPNKGKIQTSEKVKNAVEDIFIFEVYSKYNVLTVEEINLKKTKKSVVRVVDRELTNWGTIRNLHRKIDIYLPNKLYNQTVKILEKFQKENIQEEIENY